MNQKGQEEAGFRLIVEAVLVVFILVIILSVVSQISEWRFQISQRRLMEGFKKAIETPDGTVVVENELVLKQGSMYSARAFSNNVTGMQPECIEIQASQSTAFKVTNKKVIEITTWLQTNVYYQCLLGKLGCDTHCTISFGEELES